MDESTSTTDTPKALPEEEVKKYVRTFESDERALKQGSTFHIFTTAPKPPPAPSSVPRPAPLAPPVPQPIVEPPAPPPEPVSVAPAREEPVVTRTPSVDPYREMPEVAPKMPVPLTTPEPLPRTRVIKDPLTPEVLKTYESDFDKHIEKTGASKATLIAAEQDAGTPTANPAPRQKSTVLYVVSGIVLMLLSGAGAYYVYLYRANQDQPVLPVQRISAPIAVEESVSVSGSGAALRAALGEAALRPLTVGSVRLLAVATSSAEKNPLTLIGNAPGIIERNIRPDKSMLGVVSVGEEQSVFLILSVISYSDTFAGMLAWEPTLAQDLSFVTAAGASETVPSMATAVAGGDFTDTSVANHDVRMYRGIDGKSEILYGYWDAQTLIIARDPGAFAEILSRLATRR